MKKIRIVVIVIVVLALLAFVQSSSAAVTLGDGCFEAGRPNPYWTESSTLGFAIIWYSPGDAHSGDWFAYLGGAGAGGEVSKVSQVFKTPKKASLT